MGKRKGRGKASQVQKVQPRSRWSKLLVPGLLVAAVGMGAATWVLLQRSSPSPVAAQHAGGPRLSVDTDTIDFGTVRFEKFVTARFLLRNVGDQPLRIAANAPVDVVEGC